MLRRLSKEQPDSFAFTPANLAWAEAQITKYPEGRQASAVIPLLWRAQEQEGWLTRPAIEGVADMLGMAYMRVLEVASFYFMFQLQPVGTVAHIQVCGTTSCMICGAEDLIGVCKDKIAAKAHMLSADGKFSWEEVECLGSCANAPMAQIGKDYYEDLTTARMAEILDELADGKVPVPGPQNGRYAAEPKMGLTSLQEYAKDRPQYNASAQLAVDIGDSIKRIDGTEVPLTAPWQDRSDKKGDAVPDLSTPELADDRPVDSTGIDKREAPVESTGRPESGAPAEAASDKATAEDAPGVKPATLSGARDGGPDDLKMIKGVGPKLEALLNELGFYHFDQIAAWTGDEIAWVDQNLQGFKGRVTRDDWVSQAQTLASGGETEFASRVKKGDVYE
ncbi:NADH-quinone oxidoreductase subunit E [Puniceibacterium sp. IMCC21224]|uniref:NADH-quinone oxidoreductase subunit E n=1 Tax=Puniceibacterium sp. IMCC21224 TaxID=1618204 RepID=UPI00064DBCDB|nr:NADH-quinone oxidoreductase subunit E [Puniceibacterium sp. IMCC21224]KMK67064.1 NADH dehydrogenase subunit E [Puniceibacterium sp. IMCC21224]